MSFTVLWGRFICSTLILCTADVDRDWDGLTFLEVQREKTKECHKLRNVQTRAKTHRNLVPEHLQFTDDLEATGIQNTNCRGWSDLKESCKYTQSFCSIQLLPKQLLELPYGHYIIVDTRGRMMVNRSKKRMMNYCIKMLWFKPGLIQRNLVSSKKKRSQWPLLAFLDAASAFKDLSHKHNSGYNTIQQTQQVV